MKFLRLLPPLVLLVVMSQCANPPQENKTNTPRTLLATWGASGWTGHHDHRLVNSVVTEVFQSQAWGKPTKLYYGAVPTGNLPANSPMKLATVDQNFLTVKISLSEADFEKSKSSWLCHKSQYTPETIEAMHQMIKASFKGVAYFQPMVISSTEQNSLF
jgi:LmbE family N-acetylglucosaminyl deacetylase